MKFIYNKDSWKNLDMGEKNCFLQTNGRGGFASLSVIGSAARQDHTLFMSAKKAPNVRYHYLTNILEEIVIDGTTFMLSSQKMYEGEDLRGFVYLDSFIYEDYPTWVFKIDDITVIKKMIMCHGKEKIALHYEVRTEKSHDVCMKLTPLMRFTAKNTPLTKNDCMKRNVTVESACICVDDEKLYYQTNGILNPYETKCFGPMYFTQDERDGREETGYCFYNHSIRFDDNLPDIILIYANEKMDGESFEELLEKKKDYEEKLLQNAKVSSKLAKQLVISSDAYVVDRESTNGKSVIAGYPFFEDWGRDTMISLPGITLATGRLELCKSILKTFAQYEKEGLLPNLFPEGDKDPMYNSVDAPLLFINAVYEYYLLSKDMTFVKEVWDKLCEIVSNYQTGTRFHISMDTDGLISAGADLEQLTWMDVRVGDYLPTPRHGKPVEINAYWYNALCIMKEFELLFFEETRQQKHQNKAAEYDELSQKVKKSFNQKFWNEKEECLKDVLNNTREEEQVRCNQIWALTLPFTMLEEEQERKVIDKVRKELYTTAGLRTLSRKDEAFRGIYIGSMVNRDRAYHQGTVWAYPLGAYYRACISYLQKHEDQELFQHVKEGIESITDWLKEGCVGHLAEIYDGEEPTVSRGCFAQAWSDAELLLAVTQWDNM